MVGRKLPLPAHHNPLLEEEHTPLAEILIERRRLGQTDLQVRASLVGTSNATKPTNLGKFDYVHLRVPLPKALDGSGVFPVGATVPIPESYFLMRRSSDGFVSGTGMFKASYPWATKEEVESERHYIKALPGTDAMEVAGNIWITPEIAIALSKEYKITAWIEALLSEEEVVHQSTATQEPISSPPHFTKPQPQHSMSTRKQRQDSREVSIPRETRSGSPIKALSKAARDAIEARPKAIPHKKRHKKSSASNAMKERGVTPSSQLDSVADSNDERDATPQQNGDADVDASQSLADTTDPLPEDTVRVIVDSKVDDDGEVQTTHTTVKVEMPANSPDLELPHDTEGVVEIAKDLLQNMKDLERAKAEGGSSAQYRKNRADLDEAEAKGTLPALQPGHKRKSPAEMRSLRESLFPSQSPSKSTSKTQSQSASQPQSQSASQSKSSSQSQSKSQSQPKPTSQSLPAPAKSNKRSRDEYEEDLEGPEEIVEEVVDISTADEAEAVAGVNDEERKAAQREHRPAKRVRVMVPAEEYRREKVRGRALLGLGGAFAVGLLLPALSSFFA